MPEELKFKISAVDDTDKAFESAKKRADEMLKKYKEFSKIGMSPSGELKFLAKMKQQFKGIFDSIKHGNRDLRQSRKKGDMITGQGIESAAAATTGQEDILAATKLKELGKSMQSQKSDSSEIKKSLTSVSKEFKDNIKSSKKDMQEIARQARSLKGTTVGGRGRFARGAAGSSGSPTDPTEATARGLGQVGSAIPYVGAAFSAVGALYLMLSAQSRAFRQTAGQQIGGLQALGYTSGSEGGFYSGFRDLGITGGQRVNLMTAYGRQVMGRTGQRLPGTRINTMARVMSAYGLGAEQVGGYAGSLDRFSRSEDIKRQGLMMAVGQAEKVGMGGTRIVEFLDAVKESLSEAVFSGSQRSNEDIIKSLGAFASSSDQRIKAIAPEVMRSATGVFSQAAKLEGGPGAGFAMQSVWAQMRRESKGQPVSFWDVRQRLASGSTIENMKAVVDQAQQLFPENRQMAEFMLQRTGMLGSITDPRTVSNIVGLISNYDDKGKSKSGKTDVGDELEKLGIGVTRRRIAALAPQRKFTLEREVADETMRLTEANRSATIAVDAFKTAMQKTVNVMEGFAKKMGILPDISTVSTKVRRK